MRFSNLIFILRNIPHDTVPLSCHISDGNLATRIFLAGIFGGNSDQTGMRKETVSQRGILAAEAWGAVLNIYFVDFNLKEYFIF